MEIKLINFPKISDHRGNLSFVEGENHLPFDIKRVYYLYDVPFGAERGGHAHKNLKQVIIALSGAFELHLDNGRERKVVMLQNPAQGVLIDKMVWRELKAFTSNAICMVFASECFKESDYIRDYDDFRKLANRGADLYGL